MSNTLIEQNTDELEKLHKAVKDLPERSDSIGKDSMTAYEYAVKGGYSGTEKQFAQKLSRERNGYTIAGADKAIVCAQKGGYTGTEDELAIKLAHETNGINPNLNLLVLGDSIFGTGTGKKFIRHLGCKTQNYAVGGASITEISEKIRPDGSYNSLIDQFGRFKARQKPLYFSDDDKAWLGVPDNFWQDNFDEPDAVLICGGGNDYLSSSFIGNMGSSNHLYPHIYDDNRGDLDKTLVAGALHYLLRDISMTYPKAQRFFLIMHRVYQCNADTLTDGNRKLWSIRNNQVRVQNGEKYELLFGEYKAKDENGNEYTYTEPIQGISMNNIVTKIKAATSLKVRNFKPNTNANNDEYIDFELVDFDANSLYSSGTHPTGTINQSKILSSYTYDTLREAIVKICNMYGFKIIDIYNDSPLNVIPPQEQELIVKLDNKEREMWHYWDYNGGEGRYRSIGLSASKTLSSNPILLANTEYFDWIGIHPTTLGYEIGYEPFIKQALSLGTKK